MIPLTIALIAAGVIIALLSIIAYIAIQDSRRQARLKDAAYRDAAQALTEKEEAQQGLHYAQNENADFKALYNSLLRERNELVARNTALVEAMEARPTQPKRTVRKNATQATEQQ